MNKWEKWNEMKWNKNIKLCRWMCSCFSIAERGPDASGQDAIVLRVVQAGNSTRRKAERIHGWCVSVCLNFSFFLFLNFFQFFISPFRWAPWSVRFVMKRRLNINVLFVKSNSIRLFLHSHVTFKTAAVLIASRSTKVFFVLLFNLILFTSFFLVREWQLCESWASTASAPKECVAFLSFFVNWSFSLHTSQGMKEVKESIMNNDADYVVTQRQYELLGFILFISIVVFIFSLLEK